MSKLRPSRLSADLTMAGGRVVHVPVVPPAMEPASGGRIKVEIPYPADAPPEIVASVAVTNEELGVTFRRDLWNPETVSSYVSIDPGDTLTVYFGMDSITAEDLIRIWEHGNLPRRMSDSAGKIQGN